MITRAQSILMGINKIRLTIRQILVKLFAKKRETKLITEFIASQNSSRFYFLVLFGGTLFAQLESINRVKQLAELLANVGHVLLVLRRLLAEQFLCRLADGTIVAVEADIAVVANETGRMEDFVLVVDVHDGLTFLVFRLDRLVTSLANRHYLAHVVIVTQELTLIVEKVSIQHALALGTSETLAMILSSVGQSDHFVLYFLATFGAPLQGAEETLFAK